jgi:hypothetical protein
MESIYSFKTLRPVQTYSSVGNISGWGKSDRAKNDPALNIFILLE